MSGQRTVVHYVIDILSRIPTLTHRWFNNILSFLYTLLPSTE